MRSIDAVIAFSIHVCRPHRRLLCRFIRASDAHWLRRQCSDAIQLFSPTICCRRQPNVVLDLLVLCLRSQMYLRVSSRCILRFGLCECLIFVCAHIYSPQILCITQRMGVPCTPIANISIRFQSPSLYMRVAFDSLAMCVHCVHFIFDRCYNNNARIG